MHVYHSKSPVEEKDATGLTKVQTEQSNIDGEAPTLNHIEIFMACKSMYQIACCGPEGEGFKTMDDVTFSIEHHEIYSGICLTIKKSNLGQYQQYGCRFHDNCSFHVSFGYEQ